MSLENINSPTPPASFVPDSHTNIYFALGAKFVSLISICFFLNLVVL